MESRRAVIPGSEPHLREREQWVQPAERTEPVIATILIRRPPEGNVDTEALLSGTYKPPSREAAETQLTATAADMQAVTDFVHQEGLEILDSDAAKRRIQVRGTAAQMNRAFTVDLGWAELPGGQRFLTYRGTISVPLQLAGIVTAVLGFDNRPVASPR